MVAQRPVLAAPADDSGGAEVVYERGVDRTEAEAAARVREELISYQLSAPLTRLRRDAETTNRRAAASVPRDLMFAATNFETAKPGNCPVFAVCEPLISVVYRAPNRTTARF
jgi:hypothetical protein